MALACCIDGLLGRTHLAEHCRNEFGDGRVDGHRVLALDIYLVVGCDDYFRSILLVVG